MPTLQHLPHLFDHAAFATATGLSPDPWQLTVLDPTIRHGILCCSRQSGKTTAAAHRAAYELALLPNSQVLIVSATENHAAEIALRIKAILQKLHLPHHKLPNSGRPHHYVLPHNNSRFLALPCTEAAARTFTATLVLIDEAARVPDKVWHSLTGTQAAVWHQASCWLLSTPKGRTGFFHDIYTGPDPLWTRIAVPATLCPRISPEFLAQKQRELPPWVYQQDYLCQFGDPATSVFRDEDLQAALEPQPALPHHLSALPPTRYYLGLDLGQSVNHSAIVILENRAIPTGQRDPYTLEHHYEFRLKATHTERLPLQLPYTELIQRLRHLVHLPDYSQNITIVLDATGGNVFLDHLRAARLGVPTIPVILTSGHQPTQQGSHHHVPKHDLITNLEALFRERKIHLGTHPGTPPHLAELIKELQAFQRLATLNGKEHFTGKATAQDDLVIALALAAWRAVKTNPTLNHNKGIWGTERLL